MTIVESASGRHVQQVAELVRRLDRDEIQQSYLLDKSVARRIVECHRARQAGSCTGPYG